MEVIKINIEVSLSEATQKFLTSILAGNTRITPVMPETTQVHEPVKPATVSMPQTKPAPTPQPAEPAQVEKPAEPAQVEKPAEPAHSAPVAPAASSASEPQRKIEEVRKVLASKVNDHRDVIKQKLNDLGAPSVTKLDPSKYNEMYDFLVSL